MSEAVLLDTSFFIRLLNKNERLHQNAKGYYRYFLDNDFILKISTISIAEYCVIGKRSDLPFKQGLVSPFNINEAEQTGLFASILFSNKAQLKEQNLPRVLIPNDSKLFAQAHCDSDVIYYVTADKRSETPIKILSQKLKLDFTFIDIQTPFNEQFGELFS